MSRIQDNNCPHDNLSPLGHAFESAAEPVRNVVQAIAGWHPLARVSEMIRVSRTRRDLKELDDRMLSDIGVSRLDIEREGRRRFWDIDAE